MAHADEQGVCEISPQIGESLAESGLADAESRRGPREIALAQQHFENSQLTEIEFQIMPLRNYMYSVLFIV
jgi:hypothetical protein